MIAEENDPERRLLPEFDKTLAYRSDKLRQLHDYWRSKLKGREIPSRADIEPTEIPKLLPYTALIDVESNPRRFRWRLVGTHITGAMGYDYTGFYFDEKYSGPALIDLMAVYERVLQSKEPIRHFGRPTFADKHYAKYESTHLPLSRDGPSVDIIMVGLEFSFQ
jgi:hypothetical protein